MKTQRTTPTPAQRKLLDSRYVILKVSVLFLCIASSSGFSSVGRPAVPVTLSRSLLAQNAGTDAIDSKLRKRFPWKKDQSLHQHEERNKAEDEAVDEYLEFLDRRYRRLRENESKSTERIQQNFSAWNWLKQEQVTDSVISGQTQSDALYVLGVAGLASKKLLQKHQIPKGQVSNSVVPTTASSAVANAQNIIDVGSEATTTGTSKRTLAVSKGLNRTLEFLSSKRRALHQFQKQRLLSMVRLVLAGLINGPVKLARNAWELGGGKRNVIFTLTVVAAAALLVVQPVLKNAAREGVNMTIG